MSVLFRSITGRPRALPPAERQWPQISLEDYVQLMQFNGMNYPVMPGTTLSQQREEPPQDFGSYVNQLYKTNGIVFACMGVRQRLFSEARFQFQRINGGVPGDLFGSQLLAPLERPWGPSSTTGDLLTRMCQDVDLAGNSFIAREANKLRWLRPDWVTVIVGSQRAEADPEQLSHPNWQHDAEVAGYIYSPGGRNSGEDPVGFLPQNVAHFTETPDPVARFRGMTWLTSVITDVLGHKAATTHKEMFFSQGATPNVVVSLDKEITPENFQKFVEMFEVEHEGVLNAYKTLFFGGGADIKVVGANMQQLDFSEVQSHDEVSIAAAAGVPPIIANLAKGLESSTYANYREAKRAMADLTMRSLWRKVCGSLEPLVDVALLPGNSTNGSIRLWYDDRDIPFLAEDVKDAAAVQAQNATTINQLIMAGYNPDDAVRAVVAGDLRQLVNKHTGLISVQLYPPGQGPANGGTSAQNGSGNGNVPALPAGT